MTADEVEELNRARAALARQRNAIAKRLGALDVAPISMAEDLTRTLVAIEAVDRALVDAGQPHIDLGPPSADPEREDPPQDGVRI